MQLLNMQLGSFLLHVDKNQLPLRKFYDSVSRPGSVHIIMPRNKNYSQIMNQF